MNVHIDSIERFYPYEAVFLSNCFIETDTREEYDAIQKEFDFYLNVKYQTFNYKTVKFNGFSEGYCRAAWDNKVTFKVIRKDAILYYQFYDGKVRIGTGVFKRNYDPDKYYISFE